jgi:N-acyl-D-amino-acid deacylase
MSFDLVLRGGTLYDGSGMLGTRADLAIDNGWIAAVGDVSGSAKREIDVSGLAVAPGFIDIKTHSDFTLPINPKAESKVRQGVTTEVIGHCGFSVAPVLPGKVELLRDYLSPSAPWLPFREQSFAEYLDSFPATAVNAGMLVGHNTLRLMVMGRIVRPRPSNSRPCASSWKMAFAQAHSACPRDCSPPPVPTPSRKRCLRFARW